MKAEDIKRVFHAWKMIFQEHVEQLTALDSVGGDGDLGVVLRDGFRIADWCIWQGKNSIASHPLLWGRSFPAAL